MLKLGKIIALFICLICIYNNDSLCLAQDITNNDIGLTQQRDGNGDIGTQYNNPKKSSSRKPIYITITVISITIIIITFYKKKKANLILIPNRTELYFLGGTFGCPIIVYVILILLLGPLTNKIIKFIVYFLSILAFLIPLILMAKSTYLYNNKNLLHTSLSLYTKLAFIVVYILLVIAACRAGERREGEGKARYEARVRRETAKNLVVVHAFLALAIAYSIDKNISVSFKNYLNGLNY
jgi:hypothetical protein